MSLKGKMLSYLASIQYYRARVYFFLTLHAHLFLPLMNRNITFSSSISVQSVKDRSVTEAMTNYDVGLVSRAQYIAIQTIKNCKIEGYRQDEVSF